MTIEQRQVFIACDGQEFKTEEECVKYEEALADINFALKKIKQLCQAHKDGCSSCVLYNDNCRQCILRERYPSYWDLERIGIKNEI